MPLCLALAASMRRQALLLLVASPKGRTAHSQVGRNPSLPSRPQRWARARPLRDRAPPKASCLGSQLVDGFRPVSTGTNHDAPACFSLLAQDRPRHPGRCLTQNVGRDQPGAPPMDEPGGLRALVSLARLEGLMGHDIPRPIEESHKLWLATSRVTKDRLLEAPRMHRSRLPRPRSIIRHAKPLEVFGACSCVHPSVVATLRGSCSVIQGVQRKVSRDFSTTAQQHLVSRRRGIHAPSTTQQGNSTSGRSQPTNRDFSLDNLRVGPPFEVGSRGLWTSALSRPATMHRDT